jgi:hypothetical protein
MDDIKRALLVSVPVTGLMDAAYYFGGIGGVRDDTPLRAAAVATAGAATAAALLWLWLRGRDARRASAWLGVAAVVSFLGFWIGLVGPVSVAAIHTGRAAVRAGRTRAGWVGLGGGALAATAATVFCLLGAS